MAMFYETTWDGFKYLSMETIEHGLAFLFSFFFLLFPLSLSCWALASRTHLVFMHQILSSMSIHHVQVRETILSQYLSRLFMSLKK